MSRTVLVVDDDPRLLRVVQMYFELHGYEVHTAADGEEALAQLATPGTDVVVLDVMMPGMDGIEVCRALRARGDATPVVMLTAAGSRREEALSAGADRFATKPFSMEQLEAEVGAALSSRGSSAP